MSHGLAALGLCAGRNAGGLVNTAFTVLIPTPDNIQAFLEAQTGGSLNYLITTLLGSPASARAPPACRVPGVHAGNLHECACSLHTAV